jgi:hypothetical protein
MKKITLVLFIFSSLFIIGCDFGKPAYNDVQVDAKTKGESRNANLATAQNPEQGANQSEDPVAKAEREAGISNPQQGQTTPTEEKKPIALPSFIDSVSGRIKDIPAYPKSQVMNVQYGPVNGVSSAMMLYRVKDSVDTVGAFYEKSFKSNGWTLITTLKDPDSFEYTLTKGNRDQALVKVKKDPQTGAVLVMLSRAEMPEGQKVSAEPMKPVEKK